MLLDRFKRKGMGNSVPFRLRKVIVPMNYLLTNDDGIHAKGLSSLYDELTRDADCLVVAPEIEQSAVGHAITISRPLMVRRIRKNGRFFGYAVAGTPADCVKIGINELSENPIDLVISGINLGANVGINVIYSGTVSACRQSPYRSIPAAKRIFPLPPGLPEKSRLLSCKIL